MDVYRVIQAPLITEKGTLVGETANQVVFKVDRRANKIEIRRAVEAMFKVKVEDVRTVNVLGKTRRVKRALGKDSLNGLRIALQGAGSVASGVARRAAEEGARLSIADVDGARAEKLAAETGMSFERAASGEYVAGSYRQRFALASGRFAMIDDGLGFQLVPWSPSIEKQIGRHVSGIARDDGGVDWDFGRKRGLGL